MDPKVLKKLLCDGQVISLAELCMEMAKAGDLTEVQLDALIDLDESYIEKTKGILTGT